MNTKYLALVPMLIAAPRAMAATKTWNCLDSVWEAASCWVATGVPTASDDVVVKPVYGFDTSLTIDRYTGSAFAHSLVVESTSSATAPLTQFGGSLTVGGIETIGETGTGSYSQSGGTNSATQLNLGGGTAGIGSYDLSGSGELSTLNTEIGGFGNGTFSHSGGTHTVSGNLYVGYGDGSHGSYNMTFATASLSANNEYIGYSGHGEFAQSNGSNTVTNELVISGGFTSSGHYTMTYGSLSAKRERILGQFFGNGTFDQSGASRNTISQDLYVALGQSYNLHGSASLSAASEQIDGGFFVQDGGTNTVTNTLSVGNNGSYNKRHYDLSGTGQVMAGDESIGYDGAGEFFQHGGTNTITNNLTLGGTYTLADGQLDVGGNIVNGGSGGTFNFDGGTVVVHGGSVAVDNLRIAHSAGTSVAVTLDSGLTVNVGTEDIGTSGSAHVTQNGSMNSVTGELVIARNAGSHGVYELHGGTLTAGTILNNDTLSYTGGNMNADVHNAGTFNLSGSGVRTINGNVVNTGTITATSTEASFSGTYVESGHLVVDPSTVSFNSVVIDSSGYWNAGAGDNIFVSNKFTNHSLQSSLWDTTGASLTLNGGGGEEMYLAGADLGANYGGYTDNFAWGDFSIGHGVSLKIFDGNTTAGAALYVGLFQAADGLSQLGSIFSDHNIYYDPTLAGNAYLHDQRYALNGSGFLIPVSAVPLPPAMWLFGSAMVGLVGIGRRRKAACRIS